MRGTGVGRRWARGAGRGTEWQRESALARDGANAPRCVGTFHVSAMIILHDPQCADFGSETRPEQPARVRRATEFLRAAHPGWEWRLPRMADESVLALAHAPELLQQLQNPEGDFDEDTPYVPDIYRHARRSVGAALEAVDLARAGQKVFSLMRPPG